MTDETQIPNIPQTPLEPPVAHVAPVASKQTPIIIAAIIGVSIIISMMLFIQSNHNTVPTEQIPVTPTIQPSPTPPQNISRISTTSAFHAFSEEVASFSPTMNSFPLQDGTLTPPVLDTALEFTP